MSTPCQGIARVRIGSVVTGRPGPRRASAGCGWYRCLHCRGPRWRRASRPLRWEPHRTRTSACGTVVRRRPPA
jgi:hypothetical protein